MKKQHGSKSKGDDAQQRFYLAKTYLQGDDEDDEDDADNEDEDDEDDEEQAEQDLHPSSRSSRSKVKQLGKGGGSSKGTGLGPPKRRR